MNSVVKQRIADIQRGNVPAGYRKTKCGIIPDTWSCCQPKEIFSGKSIKNNDSELPVLSVTQENGVMLRSEMDKDISYKEDSVSSYKRVDIGDFVISLRSFEGGIEYSQCQGVVSPAYTIFSHSEDVDGNYYKYYFKTDFFINKLNTAVYGIRDGKQIGFQDFSNLFIHRPPQEEQRRIADILGCCDRVIALKKELIAEKKKQKKVLMHKLLNPDSGFRLPGFSGEWKSCNLGCFGECIRGVSYQPSEDLRNNYSSETYTLLRANNFGQSELNMSEVFFVDKKCVSSEQEIISGDILISMSSGSKKAVGKITLITNIAPKTCVGAFCAIFRSKNSNFLKHFFETRDYQQQLSLLLEGTNINNLTPQEIENLKVNIPDNLKEQQAIADILSAADKEIDLLEQELTQQEQKKKSLMQLLLTGIVRV